MTAPKLDASVRYRWIDGSSVLFFMGKGKPRRRAWVTSSVQESFQKVIDLAPRLYNRAIEIDGRANGTNPPLGDFITIRWLSRTKEFRFYKDKKLNYTIPQDGDTAEFREALEAIYASSAEEEAKT